MAQIWIINADGSGQPQQLTSGLVTLGGDENGGAGISSIDCSLSWSPDETQIAFTGLTYYCEPLCSQNDRFDVYWLQTAFPGALTKVTSCQVNPNNLENGGACTSPQWSPDGTSILFDDDDATFGDNYGMGGLFVSGPYGGLVNILQNGQHDYYPRYSTDGKKVFWTSPYIPTYGIYSMNADGTSTPVTIVPNNKYFPDTFDVSKCQSFDN